VPRTAAVESSTATVAAPVDTLACPESKLLRDRLRSLAAEMVVEWKANGMPAGVRAAAGLREKAVHIGRAARAPEAVAGWTMVALVTEYWRERLAGLPAGRRLLLLPDCPVATGEGTPGVPHVCGPACGIARIWAAARDHGWVVQSTDQAVSAIGSLLTGQYDGVLGVARLADLEKAFAMLPAFALPIAAVPYQPVDLPEGSCADTLAASAIDVESVLALVGERRKESAPSGGFLPLVREAAGLFTPDSIRAMANDLGLPDLFDATGTATAGGWHPLDAAAGMSAEFLLRGGKFLRPFVTLAAYDAVAADRSADTAEAPASRRAAAAAAMAIEIFHKASLVHDDIEDSDEIRYGRATLHEEVGVPSAINAGDYLLGVGYRVMAALPGIDPVMLRDAVAILADAHVRLARGQGAELWWRDAPHDGSTTRLLTPDEALTIYGLKTSPAFEAAVAIGVRLAGATPGHVADVARYALHIGTGFQVLNDLKDWAGDLENDRRAAGDLIGGRPTLLWALAHERLGTSDAARLTAIARRARSEGVDESETIAAVSEARLLYERADVVGRAGRIAAEQRRQAGDVIARCSMPRLREVLEFLLDLAIPSTALPQ